MPFALPGPYNHVKSLILWEFGHNMFWLEEAIFSLCRSAKNYEEELKQLKVFEI